MPVALLFIGCINVWNIGDCNLEIIYLTDLQKNNFKSLLKEFTEYEFWWYVFKN